MVQEKPIRAGGLFVNNDYSRDHVWWKWITALASFS